MCTNTDTFIHAKHQLLKKTYRCLLEADANFIDSIFLEFIKNDVFQKYLRVDETETSCYH